MKDPPSKYVQPNLSPSRIARLWDGISEQLDARPRRWWQRRWLAGAAALSLGAAAAGGVLLLAGQGAGPAEQTAIHDAALETTGTAMSVALVDGSHIRLDARTRVEVVASESEAIQLSLERGEVVCDVSKKPQRRFVVVAGNVEVRVVGTRFAVRRQATAQGDEVRVRVERGVVEVLAPSSDEPRRLAAGETWSVLLDGSRAKGAAATPAPAEPRLPEPPAAAPTVPPADGGPVDVPREATTPSSSAKLLLDRANQARRAGDAAGAARAYAALLDKYPGDSRAGLAAFELGRLRMDRLGDLAGAVAALKQSIRAAPGSGFREDALARLVRAHAALGHRAECERYRDAYLKSYPQGVHAATVTERCGRR